MSSVKFPGLDTACTQVMEAIRSSGPFFYPSYRDYLNAQYDCTVSSDNAIPRLMVKAIIQQISYLSIDAILRPFQNENISPKIPDTIALLVLVSQANFRKGYSIAALLAAIPVVNYAST